MKTDPVIACSRKRWFTTRVKAEVHALAEMNRPGKGKAKRRIFVYQCPHCDHWHLTRNKHRYPDSLLWPSAKKEKETKPWQSSQSSYFPSS